MQSLLGKAQLTTVFLGWPNMHLSCAGCLRAESGHGGTSPHWKGTEGMLILAVCSPCSIQSIADILFSVHLLEGLAPC